VKILVTGSMGFVGSKLVKELERQGHKVEGFSKSTGGNVLDLAAVKKAVKGKQAVFHLAAVLDETSAKEMLDVNVRGTENVVDAAAKAGVEHFVYLSTVGVHGTNEMEIDENAALQPETMYEASKARAEKMVWESQEMLPITIIRSAMVMGNNEYWKGIVKLVKKGFPLIGSGNNSFQTIYLDDLVSALSFVLGKKECFGEVYVAAGGEKPTLKEIYGMIQKELGAKGKIKSVPVWTGKIFAYAAVLKSKFTGRKTIVLPQHVKRLVRERSYKTGKLQALGWKQRHSLEKAVKETVKAVK